MVRAPRAFFPHLNSWTFKPLSSIKQGGSALESHNHTPPQAEGVSRSLQENVLTREPFVGNTGITVMVNVHEDDEHELIDRAKAGEAIAFERLARQHAAPLWRCALALGKDSHWAEDLAQETLVEAWRSLARFDGRCRFSTWLYGILRHRFLKGVLV